MHSMEDKPRFVNFAGPRSTYVIVYVSRHAQGRAEGVQRASHQRVDLTSIVFLARSAAELPRGEYGTTLPLGHVMNPANEVMVAYKQNGEDLLPDHGYPLRLVIPGRGHESIINTLFVHQ